MIEQDQIKKVLGEQLGEQVKVSVVLPKVTYDYIKEKSEKTGISISQTVRMILLNSMDKEALITEDVMNMIVDLHIELVKGYPIEDLYIYVHRMNLLMEENNEASIFEFVDGLFKGLSLIEKRNLSKLISSNKEIIKEIIIRTFNNEEVKINVDKSFKLAEENFNRILKINNIKK